MEEKNKELKCILKHIRRKKASQKKNKLSPIEEGKRRQTKRKGKRRSKK